MWSGAIAPLPEPPIIPVEAEETEQEDAGDEVEQPQQTEHCRLK